MGGLTKQWGWSPSVAPLSQILLIKVLHSPTNYIAKTILLNTQHHHTQNFAKGDDSLNQKLTFLYAKVYTTSSIGSLE